MRSPTATPPCSAVPYKTFSSFPDRHVHEFGYPNFARPHKKEQQEQAEWVGNLAILLVRRLGQEKQPMKRLLLKKLFFCTALIPSFGMVGRVTAQTFTVLHSFTPAGGSQPYAGLILSSNTLYGTTILGGRIGFGTVFKV